MSTPPKAPAKQPSSENDQSWKEHVLSDQQKAPERLEDTAKFLVGIISISLTIFISQQPEGLALWTKSWFITATIFWMVSALLSFFVFFPWRYSFHPESIPDIKRAYKNITATKRILLVCSLVAYFVALGVASYAFLCG